MLKDKVLVIDDEVGVRETLRVALRKEYDILMAENGEEGIKLAISQSVKIVILDINLPDINGVVVLGKLKEMDANITVIMVTGSTDIKHAVECMKLGAYDYFSKPIELRRLKEVVNKAAKHSKLLEELEYLRSEMERYRDEDRMIGRSLHIKEIKKKISQLADSDSTVLIQGESGTGKELVARGIHYSGARKHKPFIVVQCAAIPNQLLESELFGHEKGAFTGAASRKLGTFELANEGTLFLDEIGELELNLQAKILRAIEEREFRRVGGTEDIKINVRIIAATNVDLAKRVKKGGFRKDLYYRINVVPINLLPLRQRKEDISALALHFLEKYRIKLNSKVNKISPDALDCLKNYQWPGNIRELENTIERSIVLNNDGEIKLRDLPHEVAGGHNPTYRSLENILYTKYKEAKNLFDRKYIHIALLNAKGNIGRACMMCGMPRQTFERKMKLHNLKRDNYLLH